MVDCSQCRDKLQGTRSPPDGEIYIAWTETDLPDSQTPTAVSLLLRKEFVTFCKSFVCKKKESQNTEMVYLNMQLPSYWHTTAFYCRLVSSTGSKRESIPVDSCIKRLPLWLGIQFSDFTSPEVNWTEIDV